ncbi:hypothetical protein BDV12DRAFT_173146 [Aspergillus spectabilis]
MGITHNTHDINHRPLHQLHRLTINWTPPKPLIYTHLPRNSPEMPTPSKPTRETTTGSGLYYPKLSEMSNPRESDARVQSGDPFANWHPQSAFERTMDDQGDVVSDAWSFTDGGKKKGHEGKEDEANLVDAAGEEDFDSL